MIIEREIYKKIKKVISGKEAIIITGMRRVGKTTLLHYIMEKIHSKNKLFLDLENPLNRKYFEEENYEKIFDIFCVLGLNKQERGYVFLDEIQFVKNAPSIVKYFIDHYNLKFFLSGSASFYLKNLFTESLSGRKYIFELFPFNFFEYLKAKAPKITMPATGSTILEFVFLQINRYYEDYILYGGFPGVVLKDSVSEKKMMLKDIFTSYFQLEVMQLSDFRKTNVIRDLMLLLMERVGSKLDIQKISKELGVSRITLNEYISFLENTYFIKLVKPFSRRKDFEIRSTPKVYLCDSGLLGNLARVSAGALFENTIFTTLRLHGEINYYQKKSGAEIDFIVDKRYAYEVKSMPYAQDLSKLKNLAQELNLNTFKLVSKKYSLLEDVTYGFVL